ncbi:YfjI family protein, partial [Scandinavium manionii]|uniref:YfjI family protein n=1 Tax=Scandinavium manionii TaxID=2926520 RepID=UPI0021654ACC
MSETLENEKATRHGGLFNESINSVVSRAASYGMDYNPPGIPAQLRGVKVRLWSCGWMTPHEDNPHRFKKLPPQEAIEDLPQPYHTAPGMRKTMTHYDRALELCAALNKLAGEASGFAVPVHHVDNEHFIYGDVDLHTFDAMNDIQKAAAKKAIAAFKEKCGGAYWESSSDGNGAHFITLRDKCSPQGVIKLDGLPEAVRFMPNVSYIVLTGVNASGTPTTSGDFLADLTDESATAAYVDDFTEDPDKGAEHDSAIIASLPDDEQWQLNHGLQDCGHPSWQGRDGSDRVRSVLRGLLRKTRNKATTARIFMASTMARFESRSAGMWDLDPLKHQGKLDRIAKSTLKELLREGFATPVKLDGLTPPATALDVPKPDAALPTYSALREAAPLEARELFNLFERGIDPAMRFDSYTMITALTAAGAMVGRKYVVNARNRLNYPCLSVSLTGDSGTGKSGYMDALRQLVRMAIEIKPRDLLKAHIVEPNSPRATAELLAATTPQIVVFYFDEYGAAINNTIKADQHMRATQDMLMTAAPQRYVGGELVTKLRNSADTTTKSVKNPCYTVIGGTNSALLWDGLSKADIAGGK